MDIERKNILIGITSSIASYKIYELIRFYKRNGFILANLEFEYLGQYYYSMYNGKFDKKKFIDFLLICFPSCKNFREIKG